MSKPPNKCYIIDSDAAMRRQVTDLVTGMGYETGSAQDVTTGRRQILSQHYAILMIGIHEPGALDLVEELSSNHPDIQLIVLVEEGKPEKGMQAVKHLAVECLVKPLHPIALEMALVRIKRTRQLQDQLAAARTKTVPKAEVATDKLLETERFLLARQIVGKLSSFFSQIASDAQDGMRYFNEMPYFMSIHSRNHKILAINPTYKSHLGNHVDGNSWDIYSDKWHHRDKCPVGQSLESADVKITQAEVRYLSGARVPVIVHTAPIYDNNGRVELVLEVFAGTKEIDQLSDDIKTTQQRYQQLFDEVPWYIAVLDRRFHIAAINRRFKEDFGNHTGANFFDVLRPGSFPAYRDPISRTMRNGVSLQGEMVLTDQNGIQYNMQARTAPILTPAGKLLQVLVIFTDITERRKMQDSLTSLGMMLGTVSHNLKGTLTGLDAGLYLIEKGFYRDRPGQIEEGIDVAKLMTDRIRKLVFNILHSAKERELQLEQVDIVQFAGDVAANMENKIKGANIAFHCNFVPNIGKFEIDAALMRSAIINILENAMEACIDDPELKSYQIDFSVYTEGEDVVFAIKDNGSGMTQHHMDQMFRLFFSSKGHKGTGLGMFITKKIIRKHRGTIAVQSEPGQGTHFSIRLPRKLNGVVRKPAISRQTIPA